MRVGSALDTVISVVLRSIPMDRYRIYYSGLSVWVAVFLTSLIITPSQM